MNMKLPAVVTPLSIYENQCKVGDQLFYMQLGLYTMIMTVTAMMLIHIQEIQKKQCTPLSLPHHPQHCFTSILPP